MDSDQRLLTRQEHTCHPTRQLSLPWPPLCEVMRTSTLIVHKGCTIIWPNLNCWTAVLGPVKHINLPDCCHWFFQLSSIHLPFTVALNHCKCEKEMGQHMFSSYFVGMTRQISIVRCWSVMSWVTYRITTPSTFLHPTSLLPILQYHLYQVHSSKPLSLSNKRSKNYLTQTTFTSPLKTGPHKKQALFSLKENLTNILLRQKPVTSRKMLVIGLPFIGQIFFRVRS